MHIRWNCGASQKMVSLRLCPIQNVFSLVHFRKGSILWCFIQWLISCYQHHQGMPSLYGTFTSNRNWLVRPSSSYLLQCSSNQYYCFFYWRAALTSHEDVIQSLSWKIDGGAMVTTCKDRKVRIVDPRCADAVSLAAESHSSNRESLAIWLGASNRILTSGFDSVTTRYFFSSSVCQPLSLHLFPMVEQFFSRESGVLSTAPCINVTSHEWLYSFHLIRGPRTYSFPSQSNNVWLNLCRQPKGTPFAKFINWWNDLRHVWGYWLIPTWLQFERLAC